MFGEEPPKDGEPVILKNGEYIYYPCFLDREQANFFLEAFKNNIEWKQEFCFYSFNVKCA